MIYVHLPRSRYDDYKEMLATELASEGGLDVIYVRCVDKAAFCSRFAIYGELLAHFGL